jgi:hypothetical protein
MQSRRPLSLPTCLASPHNSESIEQPPMTVGAHSIEFRNETSARNEQQRKKKQQEKLARRL